MRFQRTVLVACTAAAVALAACGSEDEGDATAGAAGTAAKEQVDFVLNFTPGPQHTEFVVADEEGYYDEAGLDVEMRTPAATTDPIKLVASGQADVGVAYAGDVISAAAQGVPVESIATIHRRIALGLLSKPGSGIEKPQDLIGKTVGLTAIPNNRAMFDDFLERNGVDASQVKVVPVNFNGPQLVAAGKIDACDAVSWYENGVYKQLTGEDPDYLEFTDYGVPDGYFFTLITSKRFRESNEETLKKFVEATLEAEKWTLENRDEATKILVDNVEDVSPEFAKDSRKLLETVIVDDAAREHGIGWSDPQVWATQEQFYEDTGQIEESVDTSQIFTNDLLPSSPVKPQL